MLAAALPVLGFIRRNWSLLLLAGVAATPGVYAATLAWPATASWAPLLRVFAGCCLALVAAPTPAAGPERMVVVG